LQGIVNADEIAKGLSPFQPEKVAIEATAQQIYAHYNFNSILVRLKVSLAVELVSV
jgi:predicted ABC-type ATPase